MTSHTAIPSNIVRAGKILGSSVKNPQQENLGTIEEIMLDKFSGETCYVVLSFGGILGIGEKLFAVPWQAMHYDKALECFILNVDKERLKNAPGFDKNHYPDANDLSWRRDIDQYYHIQSIHKEIGV